ncbi:UDP-glucuronosyl/UDP-glucosyltransferase [Artemisia annua]|uniref:UDP-glucuronosyl/UDP-glucosyltransferase n=1 Tax=Artemisia annua TaxID=35608 RepID=A0A2U1PLJ1_ARTAN|nr:UDP-glucuronosyl/UDP-glucosyltransferase [Artemisia annua]
MEADLVIMNFFSLEGWSLAELFNVRCVIAAPYVVPYSAPSSFEQKFSEELPLLYDFLQEASSDKICWKYVMHWMWPLFTDDWRTRRATKLQLSPLPFTDPVTSNLVWHSRPSSPLLLYGFSKEVVECPGYCPSNVHFCAFVASEVFLWSGSSRVNNVQNIHATCIHWFEFYWKHGLYEKTTVASSCSSKCYRAKQLPFILFSSGYGPLDAATRIIARETSLCSKKGEPVKNGISFFSDRLFCFSGYVPYKWLFPKCAATVHHVLPAVILKLDVHA